MRPINRGVRYALTAFAALMVVVVLGVVFFPWNMLRGPLASMASHRIERPVSIDGDLSVRLGWTTRVQIDGVSIGNVDWSKDQPMAQVKSAVFVFTIPSLLRGQPTGIRLVEPVVLLERNAKGADNWHFPNRGGEAPRLGKLDVERGVLRYRDAVLAADVRVGFNSETSTQGAPSLRFDGQGTYRKEPFKIEGRSRGLEQLQNANDPYELSLKARAGRTSVEFTGTVVPAQPENLRGSLKLQGPDVSQLYPIVPAPLPWTPPYTVSGELTHANAIWALRGMKGTVGQSDIAGDVSIDLSKERTNTVANLSSAKFDYKDLGGFVGLPPGDPDARAQTAEQRHESDKRAKSSRVLPDKPFELTKLRDHDVDVTFKGKSVKWGDVPIDGLVAHLTLKNGVMRFEPLDFGIADGHIVSNVTLDLSRQTPQAQGQIEARRVELKRLFPALASPKGSAGRVGGRAHFKAEGNNVAALFGSANGEAAMAMRGGEASTLQLVLTNLDLARAVELFLRGDETAEIRCAVAALRIENGAMTPDLMVIDTSAVVIEGEGSVSFRDEAYDLQISGKSKRPSLIALRGPIEIGGTFKSPTIHPATGPLIARVGATIGLGVVSPPLALLPLIDLGTASDTDCRALYEQARVNTNTTERIERKAPQKPNAGQASRTKAQRQAAAQPSSSIR